MNTDPGWTGTPGGAAPGPRIRPKFSIGVGHKFKCTVPSVFSVGTKIKELEVKVKRI
jgi:hypothetical protein